MLHELGMNSERNLYEIKAEEIVRSRTKRSDHSGIKTSGRKSIMVHIFVHGTKTKVLVGRFPKLESHKEIKEFSVHCSSVSQEAADTLE